MKTRTLLRASCVALAALLLQACGGKSEQDLIASARAQMAKGDAVGAGIHLKNALAKNPSSPTARLLLGQSLLASGAAVQALTELSRAQELGAPEDDVVPEMARAMLRTGDYSRLLGQFRDTSLRGAAQAADLKTSVAAALAARGELTQAREVAQAAFHLHPAHFDAAVLLARLDASEGDVAGALQRLDEVIARGPAQEAAGLLKGEILLRATEDPEAALRVFRQVHVARPDSVAALTAIINTLLQQGRLADARPEMEKLKKLAPKHPDSVLMQAQMAFDDKDFKASRELTDRLLTSSPKSVRVLLLAAAAEYMQGHLTLAEGLLSRALKEEPDHLPTRHLLAQTLIRAAQPEKAVEVLKALVAKEAVDSTSLRLTGEAWLLMGDGARAEVAFQRAVKAAPGDKGLRTALVMSQLARGEAAALQQLEVLAQGDTAAQADMALVNARMQRNDLKGALGAADGLARKLPTQAFPLVLKGRILAMQKNWVEARSSFEQALAKDANSYPATAGLAALDFSSGKIDQARARLVAAGKANPKNFRPHVALAELESLVGAPDPVVQSHLRAAIKLDPTQVQPHLKLVEGMLLANDLQGAQTAAQEAGTLLPDSPEIMELLGRTQMAAGDYQRAISTFKKMADLNPRWPVFHIRMAEAQVAANDLKAAELSVEKALALAPDDVAALRWQARLAVLNGKFERGIELARLAQKRRPKEAFGFALEGELEAGKQNWDAATSAYGAALQRERVSELAIKRHQSLLSGGKSSQADRWAQEWLTGNAKDAHFLFYLGDKASAKQDWAVAEAHYRAVLAVRPRHATSMNNVAWLLARQGKPGAVAAAEAALALTPQRANLLDTLAFALASEKQVPRAIEVQKQAVALDGKDPALRWRLVQLLIQHGDKSAARKELAILAGLGDRFGGQAEVAALLKSL